MSELAALHLDLLAAIRALSKAEGCTCLELTGDLPEPVRGSGLEVRSVVLHHQLGCPRGATIADPPADEHTSEQGARWHQLRLPD